MNNNSKVLALKYRPQTFDDLIGQEVVAETITNSIKADKIPNAYFPKLGSQNYIRVIGNSKIHFDQSFGKTNKRLLNIYSKAIEKHEYCIMTPKRDINQ